MGHFDFFLSRGLNWAPLVKISYSSFFGCPKVWTVTALGPRVGPAINNLIGAC